MDLCVYSEHKSNVFICFFQQFDQSDLLLPSAEYYQLGFNHQIIQSYYAVLLNTATLLGAEPEAAKREMKELIEFEMNLASVSNCLVRDYVDIFQNK